MRKTEVRIDELRVKLPGEANPSPRPRPVFPFKMFFCGISGEPPQDPVVSSKSGHVYERRLIQKYITENGTDPLTGEKLEENDLITIKASTRIYPTSASIQKLNVV